MILGNTLYLTEQHQANDLTLGVHFFTVTTSALTNYLELSSRDEWGGGLCWSYHVFLQSECLGIISQYTICSFSFRVHSSQGKKSTCCREPKQQQIKLLGRKKLSRVAAYA
ncbi:uncharacterized protein [Triticum aestivum]|uniref:uncharacterized protein isoform X2 n=1 Tax=Triticum aestivum TaxID=4565 RepID=UPI001D012ABB|nr:uncharacterized protein LOC123091733 isoform X2 [Triticum aestivum]